MTAHTMPSHPLFINIAGTRYGRLVAVEYAGKRGKTHLWRCICACGGVATVQSQNLKSGHSKSCGCLKIDDAGPRATTHGKTGTKMYQCYANMKRRCYEPSASSYEYYGARGITVCNRWLVSFENFYADMGDKPSPSHSIDRIDTNLGYSLKNCRWATATEQANNQRLKKCNKTGVAGVHFYTPRGKWVSRITVNGGRVHLGYFYSFFEACCARKSAELRRAG